MSTFQELMRQIATIDDAQEIKVDVEALVGNLRDKVDSIQHVASQLEAMEQYFKAKAEPYLAAAKSAARERKALRDHCAYVMQAENFERVPGIDWRMQLQDSPMSIEYVRAPTAQDWKDNPQYVRLVREWNKEAIANALKAGLQLPFAVAHKGKHVRFYLNTEKTYVKRPSTSTKSIPATATSQNAGASEAPVNQSAPKSVVPSGKIHTISPNGSAVKPESYELHP